MSDAIGAEWASAEPTAWALVTMAGWVGTTTTAGDGIGAADSDVAMLVDEARFAGLRAVPVATSLGEDVAALSGAADGVVMDGADEEEGTDTGPMAEEEEEDSILVDELAAGDIVEVGAVGTWFFTVAATRGTGCSWVGDGPLLLSLFSSISSSWSSSEVKLSGSSRRRSVMFFDDFSAEVPGLFFFVFFASLGTTLALLA